MYGLAMIEVISLSGHLSNIDEIGLINSYRIKKVEMHSEKKTK